MLIKGTPAILRDSYNPIGPSGLMGLAAQGQKFLTANPEYELTYEDLQKSLIQAANDPYLLENPWQQKEILMNYLNNLDFTIKDIADTLGRTEQEIIDFINLDTDALKKQQALKGLYKSILEQIDAWQTKYNRTLTEAKRLSAFSLIDALKATNYTAQDLAQANNIPLDEVNAFIALATAERTGPEMEVQTTVKMIENSSGNFVGNIELPTNWGSYTPQQKISFFNENSITKIDLLNAGVTMFDIDWMLKNGYTGEPEAVTKARNEAQQRAVKAIADAEAQIAADIATQAAADAAAKQLAADLETQAAAKANAQAAADAAKAAADIAAKAAADAAAQAAAIQQTQTATQTQTGTQTNKVIPLVLAAAAAYFFGG